MLVGFIENILIVVEYFYEAISLKKKSKLLHSNQDKKGKTIN